MKSKSGVSAIVATVLILLITVAAVSLLFGLVLPGLRDDLDVTSSRADLFVLKEQGYTVYDANMDVISLQVKRGQDEVELSGLKFVVTLDDGNSFIYIKRDKLIQKGQTRTYYLNLTDYRANSGIKGIPVSVRIAPLIKKGDEEIEGLATADVSVESKKILDAPSESEIDSPQTDGEDEDEGDEGDKDNDETEYTYISFGDDLEPNLNNVRWIDSGDDLNDENIYYDESETYAYWNDGVNWIISNSSSQIPVTNSQPQGYFIRSPESITVVGAGNSYFNGVYERKTINTFINLTYFEKSDGKALWSRSFLWRFTSQFPSGGLEYTAWGEHLALPPKTGWVNEPSPTLEYDLSEKLIGFGSFTGSLTMEEI